MSDPNPFLYPPAPLSRKHGPSGYTAYDSYRPWLRDEFVFRCAYCLCREAWSRRKGNFDLDHAEPQVLQPELELSYDNLVYSCHRCNLIKGSSLLPIPSAVSLLVNGDGTISWLNDDGERLVDLLSLDDAENTNFRRMKIGIIRTLSRVEDERETFILAMGFPIHDLPDLGKMKPDHNSRPEGLLQSWHAKNTRGELPPFYE
jgi:hypothetical protein